MSHQTLKMSLGFTAVVALVLVSAGVASAGVMWTSYNDVVWCSGQLATNITKAGPGCPYAESGPTGPYSPTSAALVDYADGALTGVTATFTFNTTDGGDKASGPNGMGGTGATNPGDAYTIFNGKVDTVGWVRGDKKAWGNDSSGAVTLAITGLNPAYTYTFVSFGGSGIGWASIGSIVTLSDVTSATNNSSSGTTIAGLQTTSSGVNTTLVSRYDDIVPGADGDFTVTFRNNGSGDTGQVLNAFMLTPEPATLALLAIGGLGMLVRRRSRKS